MNARFTRRRLLWLCPASPLFSAGFWTSRNATVWTDDEVDRLLTDSPWAKRITPKIKPSSSRRKGMELPGGIGVDSHPQPATPSSLLRWTSALPIQLALLAKRYGSEAPRHLPTGEPPAYEIELLGLPERHAMRDDDLIREELHATTALCRDQKHDLSPECVQLVPVEGRLNFVFHFPKHDPIRPEDKEVTFVTAFGPVRVSRKFKLKSMDYQGRLCL